MRQVFAFTEFFVAMDEKKGNKRGRDRRGRGGGQGRGERRDEGGGGGSGLPKKGGGGLSRGEIGGAVGTPGRGGTPSRGGWGGAQVRGRGRGGGAQGRAGMVPSNQFEPYLSPEEVQRGLHDGEEPTTRVMPSCEIWSTLNCAAIKMRCIC